MTMQELIEMTGSEEQAQYALEILLKNVKREFVLMAIKAEIKEIEAEAESLVEEGILYEQNGSYNVAWMAADRVYGDEPGSRWNATPEQEAEHDRIEARCYDANALLYRKNRTTALIAVR